MNLFQEYQTASNLLLMSVEELRASTTAVSSPYYALFEVITDFYLISRPPPSSSIVDTSLLTIHSGN